MCKNLEERNPGCNPGRGMDRSRKPEHIQFGEVIARNCRKVKMAAITSEADWRPERPVTNKNAGHITGQC